MTTQQVCFEIEVPNTNNPDIISMKEFAGFDNTGLTDQSQVFDQALLDASAEGKWLYIPTGDYLFNSPIVIGDSTPASESTLHNVKIKGAGMGSHAGISNAPQAQTRFIYGGTDQADCFINLNGGITNVQIDNIKFDCNNKSAGIKIDHNWNTELKRVNVDNYKGTAYDYTTKDNGLAYGNCDLRQTDCYAFTTDNNADAIHIRGQAGQRVYDTCRLYVDGGHYIYGGATGSAGVRAGFADNNYLRTMCIPIHGNRDAGGHSIFFEQYPEFVEFPLENVFDIKGHQGIGGVSGTVGNKVYLSLSDGMPVNLLDNIHLILSDGREYIGQDRLWRTIGTDIKDVQAGVFNTGSSHVNAATVMSTTINLKTNEKIEIDCTGRGAKGGSQSGYGALFIDGTQIAGTQNQFDATGYYKTHSSVDVELDNLTAGQHVIEFRVWSDNGQPVFFADGSLSVERKF